MIFLVWLRIAPLPGCKVTPAAGDNALECAVWASSRAEVPEVLEAALHHHRYRLDELEACVEFDPAAWDARTDPDGRVRAAVDAARARRGVEFASLGRVPDRR